MHVHKPDPSKTVVKSEARYINCKCGTVLNVIKTKKK